jgi:hypothetical protein
MVRHEDHVEVAASETDFVLGSARTGNVLERLVVTVNVADATSAVTIKDGNGSAIPIVPPSAPIGVYSMDIGAINIVKTDPGWKVTTLAGATVMAIGRLL